MNFLRSRFSIWSLIPALALLASCTGAPQSSGPLGLTNSFSSSKIAALRGAITSGHHNTSLATPRQLIAHPDRRRSWVSPAAKGQPRVLFVSDYNTGDVYMFDLPDMTLVGTLTGFDQPQGLCNDKHGNVWVTETGSQVIAKYSHAGTLITTLSDSVGQPTGCAVNPVNGDLAVTNQWNGPEPDCDQGSVIVYASGSGSSPVEYQNSNQAQYFFAAYDAAGNLYVNGFSGVGCGSEGNGSSVLSELSAGASSLETLSVSGGTINWPGAVQWNKAGNYLDYSDQVCGGSITACIYYVSISGSGATITGSASLNNIDGGPSCDVVQPAVGPLAKFVAGTDWEGLCDYTASASERWHYAGGNPTNDNDTPSYSLPIGTAISD